jgi:hypothetical protein
MKKTCSNRSSKLLPPALPRSFPAPIWRFRHPAALSRPLPTYPAPPTRARERESADSAALEQAVVGPDPPAAQAAVLFLACAGIHRDRRAAILRRCPLPIFWGLLLTEKSRRDERMCRRRRFGRCGGVTGDLELIK